MMSGKEKCKMANAENNRVEYKAQFDETGDKLEIAVIGFLNAQGGTLFYGIDDNGKVIDIENPDELQQKITNRITDKIKPNTLGLVDVFTREKDGKTIVGVSVSSGLDTPYHLEKFGRVPNGTYQRFGSTTRKMTYDQIDRMMRHRHFSALTDIPSKDQNLSFKQLTAAYAAGTSISFNKNYMKTLEFFTPEGKYNLLAYLFADKNKVFVRLAKWWGADKSDMREREEYGECSLIQAMNKILVKFDVENVNQARKVAMKPREEKTLVDKDALHEAIKNAFAHNDYSNLDAPMFEIYSDKFEVISFGGLVEGFTKDEFFKGISRPRSREIMKIFQDLDLVDYHGSGVQKITDKYGKKAYEISDNFIRTTLTFDRSLDEDEGRKIAGREKQPENSQKTTRKTAEKILELLRNNPSITIPELAEEIGLSVGGVRKNIKTLKNTGKIERIDSNKSGSWKVLSAKSSV